MHTRKTVLTTGEVARLCNVAPRTVSKWFDAGQLRGYRIPGSKDRRIPVEHLVRFMRAHGMPLNGLDQGLIRVLILDGDLGLTDTLRVALTENGGYEVATAGSALEAGAAARELEPDVFVVDMTLPDITPAVVTRFVRTLAPAESVRLIGTAPGLTQGEGQALLQGGFHAYLSKPFDVRSLIQLIEQVTPVEIPEGTE
ncbi:MAG: response regulator [Phycisphaerae bacterium]|jgi:excisionase family DNA binding protein